MARRHILDLTRAVTTEPDTVEVSIAVEELFARVEALGVAVEEEEREQAEEEEELE